MQHWRTFAVLIYFAALGFMAGVVCNLHHWVTTVVVVICVVILTWLWGEGI